MADASEYAIDAEHIKVEYCFEKLLKMIEHGWNEDQQKRMSGSAEESIFNLLKHEKMLQEAINE